MTDERLCASRHVIDAGRETCSRCNGAPVNQSAPEAAEESSKARRGVLGFLFGGDSEEVVEAEAAAESDDETSATETLEAPADESEGKEKTEEPAAEAEEVEG